MTQSSKRDLLVNLYTALAELTERPCVQGALKFSTGALDTLKLMRPHLKRVVETNEGIQGQENVALFDAFQRRMRDKGWMETEAILRSGLSSGHALELGHGPGYGGLEWLSRTQGTTLTGLDISPDMVEKAKENAQTYHMEERATFVAGAGVTFPFPDGQFDGVFTTSSLHEWEHPLQMMAEIHRVLKPGGRWFIADLQRLVPPCLKAFIYLNTKPRKIRRGFLTSVNAAYTKGELRDLLDRSPLTPEKIKGGPLGITAYGQKELD